MDRFDDLHDADGKRLADLLAQHLARDHRDVTVESADEQAAPETPKLVSPEHGPEGSSADAEFAELAALGDRLADLGPTLARITAAEDRFDLAFAGRLRRELLAAHPAAQAPTPSAQPVETATRAPSDATVRIPAPQLAGTTAPAAPTGSTGSAAAGARRWSVLAGALGPRRLLALVTLVAAVALGLLVHALATGKSQPAIVATGAPTTPVSLAHVQAGGPQGHAALAPRGIATAQSPTRGAAGTAAHPVDAPTGAAGPAAAAVRPTVAGRGVQQRSALSVTPLAPPAMRYRLPATLPTLPGRAVSYTLRYRPLGISALAARFPTLRAAPSSSSATETRTDAAGTSVRVVSATGEVSYRAATPPRTGAFGSAAKPGLAPARRAASIQAARRWLVKHGLYPADVAATPLVTALDDGRMLVRFLPALPLPLQGGQGAIDLSVELGPGNRILAAHALWPRRMSGTSLPVRPLTQSLAHAQPAGARSSTTAGAGEGAAAQSGPISTTVRVNTAPTFVVRQVRLVYVAQGLAPAASLQPAYLLLGTLTQPAGTSSPYSQIVPAR